jgi:signal transduction histidine kinase
VAGRSLQVSATVDRLRDLPGAPVLWLLRDVTERRRDERQILTLNAELERRLHEGTVELEAANRASTQLLRDEQRARERLAGLLGRLDQAVLTIQPDLTVEYANEAAERILGVELPHGGRMPDPWPEFSLPKLVRGLLATGEPATEHVRLRRGSAELSYVVRGLPADGATTAVVMLFDDSERERRERTQRDFVTNAAHELQTPLAAIVSATEVLQSGAKDIPEQRDRFLAHVEREAGRLVRLTRALLVLARVQAIGEQPPLAALELRPPLRAIAAMNRPRDGVELTVRCAPGLRAVTNGELLEQLLSELTANAVKQTTSGRITLVAKPAGRDVAIEVRDTGQGIDGDASRIFERFYRSGAGGGHGFGLGLAIVREIAGAIGAELDICSSSRGTTVRLTLPGADTS